MSKKPEPQSWQDSLKALLANAPVEDTLPSVETHEGTKADPGRLDIIYERKGRAGKPATIISGFADGFPDSEIEDLAAAMKKSMGCGGSYRGGEILLQGDRRNQAMQYLTKSGFKARII